MQLHSICISGGICKWSAHLQMTPIVESACRHPSRDLSYTTEVGQTFTRGACVVKYEIAVHQKGVFGKAVVGHGPAMAFL